MFIETLERSVNLLLLIEPISAGVIPLCDGHFTRDHPDWVVILPGMVLVNQGRFNLRVRNDSASQSFKVPDDYAMAQYSFVWIPEPRSSVQSSKVVLGDGSAEPDAPYPPGSYEQGSHQPSTPSRANRPSTPVPLMPLGEPVNEANMLHQPPPHEPLTIEVDQQAPFILPISTINPQSVVTVDHQAPLILPAATDDPQSNLPASSGLGGGVAANTQYCAPL
jgi:hypothetical protein